MEVEEKKKDRRMSVGLAAMESDPVKAAEKLAEMKQRAVEEQMQKFGGKKSGKPDEREKELLAQSASLPQIGGANNNANKKKASGDQFGFVSKSDERENYKRSGRRRSSFGSVREKQAISSLGGEESLPSLDPLGRGTKGNKQSKTDMEKSKRNRRMRKTLEPGSVLFDTGLTKEDLVVSGKKREERRTIAKEKREAMLEAQRAAVLDCIDTKEEKRKAFQRRKELQVLQRKVRRGEAERCSVGVASLVDVRFNGSSNNPFFHLLRSRLSC